MAVVDRTWTVKSRGIGQPDYTREIHAARERSGIALKYNQRFIVFAGGWSRAEPLYPLSTPYNIPVGDYDHLHDSDTLAPLPITIAQGYTLTMISEAISVTEDLELYAYTDSILATNIGQALAGQMVYENKIREFSTIWYDPTASLPHTLDILAYNRGGAELHGAIALLCILEKIGSADWPETKDTMCPYCQSIQTVSITATRIICEQCGKLFMVTAFRTLRELG